MSRPLHLVLALMLAAGVTVSGCSASTSVDGQDVAREAAGAEPSASPSLDASPSAVPTEPSASPSLDASPSAVPTEPSASPSLDASPSAVVSVPTGETVAHTSQVTSLTATARDRSVDLAWGPAPAIGPGDPPWRFEVRVAGSDQRDWTLVVTGKPSINVSHLTNGVQYVFTLTTGPGVFNPLRAKATPMPAPGPPDGLIGTSKNPGEITFYWLRPREGTRPSTFAVRYSVNDGAPVYAETADDTENFTVTNLRRGDVVTLAAASRNQYGMSAWSAPATRTATAP